MNPVGDAFTVGIVLLLLIGAVAFYLYTRLSQVEKRMGVLENILLDLKVATENSFMGFPNPASSGRGSAAPTAAELAEEEELLSEYVPKLPTAHLGGAIEADEIADDDDAAMYEQALESALDSGVTEITDIAEAGGEGGADADADADADSDAVDSKAIAVTASADAGASAKSGVHVNKLEPNYSSLAVKELRTLAQNHGITGVAKMSRKELIEALNKKDSGVVDGVHSSSASNFGSALNDNAATIDA